MLYPQRLEGAHGAIRVGPVLLPETTSIQGLAYRTTRELACDRPGMTGRDKSGSRCRPSTPGSRDAAILPQAIMGDNLKSRAKLTA